METFFGIKKFIDRMIFVALMCLFKLEATSFMKLSVDFNEGSSLLCNLIVSAAHGAPSIGYYSSEEKFWLCKNFAPEQIRVC